MVELTSDTVVQPTFRTSFYFWMAIVMAFVIFGGFGISYLQPLLAGTLRPLSPIVHIHGMFYFAWMIFLVFQAALVNSGNTALHRNLGMAGISIATGLVIFASIVTVLLIGAQLELNVNPDAYGLMYISILAIGVFSALFVLAIRNVRDSQAHKRFILLATIGFLGAGINRFYSFLLGVDFAPFWVMYMLADLLIVAMVIHDWRTLGRVHRATLIGATVNIIPQLLHGPIVATRTFESLTQWLVSLAGYTMS